MRVTVPTAHLVSVVVPLWNSERYLAETIASIAAQRIEGMQVVFVDDGSTDRSAFLARSLAPDALHCGQAHQGISAALNRGLSLASGRYVTFLDADDLWPAQSLALRLAACLARPSLDLVAGHVRPFASPDLDEDFRRSLAFPEQPLPGYLLGAMLIRRGVYDRVGGFDAGVSSAQSVDWVVRALDAGVPMGMIPDVVLLRRLHRGNHSHERLQLGVYPRILKASLDRRRAANQGVALPLPGPADAGG